MKIKRFFAPDIRQAIRQVRVEQGPDAVILSNRRVDGGVEIVAAVDYDEGLVNELAISAGGGSTPDRSSGRSSVERSEAAQSGVSAGAEGPGHTVPPKTKIIWSQEPALVEMRRELRSVRGLLEHQLSGLAWGELARRHPLRTRLLRLLLEAGFSPSLSERVAEKIPDNLEFTPARRLALGILAHQLPVTDDDILQHGGVVALVGSTGVGKTTTAAKLAARFALRHGSRHVALVTTDNYRIGAHEQLRTYAQVMDLPLRVARTAEELSATLKSLDAKRLVLIDTAGMSQRDLRLAEQFSMIREGSTRVQPYLVLAATTEMQAVEETVAAFQGAALRGCILTKVDEASSLGPALSVIIRHQFAVAYVGNGQRVPEDLRPARAHGLISNSIAISAQARERQRRAGQHTREYPPTGRAGSGRDIKLAQKQMLKNVEMALTLGGG